MFRQYLTPALLERWESFSVRRYATSCYHISQCPAPGCEYVLLNSDMTRLIEDVECKDGHVFCFACRVEGGGHAPATCESVSAWNSHYKDAGYSAQWIAKNTKPCPNSKCKLPIERHSGCNKVICSQCGTALCFACGREYYKEAGHS